MSDSLGNKAAKGVVWASIDRFSMMGLQFAVNLILARLLIPADFGAIGMLAIFIAVSTVLIDGGFGSALIQKKAPTQTDYSTIFYWNVIFSTFLYAILFLTAPLIADFYKMPVLSGVLRGWGLTLIISSILTVQRVKLQKALAFKTLAITNICAYVTGSAVGIVMAYRDWGVWSLVTMQVMYAAIAVAVLAIITRWHPSLCFSKKSMRELFSFGGFIMAASILQEVCKNLQGILIGKKFSATQMGYFSQAYKLDNITSYSIPQVIVQVMYPVYSSIQDDRERLNEMVLMNIRVISFLIFPMLALLILIGEPLITLLYGDKWLPSVPYFQVLCVGGFFVCLQNVNFYAVAAVGKSKQLFYWSLYKWGFLLAALLVGMTLGMYGILWGMVISNMNIFLVNCFLASRHVGITVDSQLKALIPMLLATGVSFLLTCGAELIYPSLAVNIALFLTSYLVISYLFRFKALNESMLLVKKLLHR